MDNLRAMLVIYPVEDGHIIGFVAPGHGEILARNILKFNTLNDLEEHGNKILEYCRKIKEDGIPPEIMDAFKDEGNQEQS